MSTNRRSVLLALSSLPLAALPAWAEEKKSDEKGWKPLWDGKTLTGWKRTEFAGGGEVKIDPKFRNEGPAILVDAGESLSGLNWTGEAPKTNYEISLESMKVQGNDFMCGLTFPVGETYASLILGGWGGSATGISNVDNSSANENPTTTFGQYARNRWYGVRVRVTPEKLQAWLDEKQIVDQEIKGHKINLRHGAIELSVPIGLCTYQTSAAYRAIRLRTLKS